MSETIPKVYQQNDLIDDAVTLFANGQIFHGWKNVNITRQLNSMADTVSITFKEKYANDSQEWRLKPGDLIHIHLGKASVFLGYLEVLSVSMEPNGRALTITGRSKTCDLIDCSASDNVELTGLKLDAICRKLLEPFGLKVVVKSDVGAPISKFNREQGETVFQIIDRLAREREILCYPSPNGNLVLEKRGGTLAQKEIIQGENVLSASAEFNNTQRFSRYIVKGQTNGLAGATETQATQSQATFDDEGITRYRPKVIVSENPVNNASALSRASYEANIALAKSAKVSVTLLGWFQASGVLWDVNQLVEVDLPFLGIKTDLLISKVNFTKDSGGTKCNMDLINPNAFDFENRTQKKKLNKENDLAAFLGRLKKVSKE